MKHHTKDKGDLGVLKAQLDLYEKGYMILTPQTEHSPFDLVVYKNFKFLRVQVKYREVNSKGVISISLKSTYSTSKGLVIKKVDKSEIDLYCVYCKNTDKCYYFDPNLIKDSIDIRVNKTKNGQTKGVNFAEDYLDIPNLAL